MGHQFWVTAMHYRLPMTENAFWFTIARRPSASLNPSPTSVQLTTTTANITPGAAATHGALTSVSRPEAIMLPQDGVGGWTPSPKNDNPASISIAFPTPRAAVTTTGVRA